MDQFKRVCKKNRLRITPQRAAIYKAVMNDAEHPTAEHVYRSVRKGFPFISFDTVNRTLICFADIGLISPIECFGHGRTYESNPVTHHHMMCMKCGAIIDFYHRPFDQLKVPTSIRKQFNIVTTRVVLNGICPTCTSQEGGKNNGN